MICDDLLAHQKTLVLLRFQTSLLWRCHPVMSAFQAQALVLILNSDSCTSLTRGLVILLKTDWLHIPPHVQA